MNEAQSGPVPLLQARKDLTKRQFDCLSELYANRRLGLYLFIREGQSFYWVVMLSGIRFGSEQFSPLTVDALARKGFLGKVRTDGRSWRLSEEGKAYARRTHGDAP